MNLINFYKLIILNGQFIRFLFILKFNHELELLKFKLIMVLDN
ncbi:hypothetical protein VAE122_50014 [Vibrio aestuarianus]|nr:hypothetical protein VAE122_50014 [Vibrio aestuarianus]